MKKTIGIFLIQILFSSIFLFSTKQSAFAYLFECGDPMDTNFETLNQCSTEGGCVDGQRCIFNVNTGYHCMNDSSCDGYYVPHWCNNTYWGYGYPGYCVNSNHTCAYNYIDGFHCVDGFCDPYCATGELCACDDTGGVVTCNCVPNPNPPPAPTPTSTPAPGEPFQPSYCNILVCRPHGGNCSRIQGISTAFGCLPFTPIEFLYYFRTTLLGIAVGFALLLMILGAFFILTSQGQPERVKRGKEIFIAAVAGILFMIFAAYILSFIVGDLLQLWNP